MPRFLLCVLLTGVLSSLHAETSPAPAFTIQDDQGQEISLPRQHDGVDIYFFWATWCPYCKALMPHLQSIVEEYGEEVRIYAFNIREDGDPRAVLDRQGYGFTLIPEADSLMELYHIKGTPGLLLVDGKGDVQLNLYSLIERQDAPEKGLSHSRKAARKAPWWAAKIRQQIDRILGGSN